MIKSFMAVVALSVFSLTSTANLTFNPNDLQNYLTNQHTCGKCDLSGVTIGTALADDFKDSLIVESDLSNAKLTGNFDEGMFLTVNFTNATLNTSCQNCNLVNSKFTHAKINDTTTMLDFSHANFGLCDLSSAQLSHVNLSNTDMEDAILKDAVLEYVDLTGSNVTAEQLQTAKSVCHSILPDGSQSICGKNS